ncbi:MAG: helix-hairpin-helix domain-containing protein [Candidatus Kariarchaeaceae archaeon]|jgi:hypothetical protein
MSSDGHSHPQILPEFWILRDDNGSLVETRHFRPMDLLTLVIRNTGDWRTTQVTMTDEIGQNRYGGMTSGANHVLTTRLQNTRSFGEWLLHVEGPLIGSEHLFQINLVFHIDEDLPSDREEKAVELVTEGDGVDVIYSTADKLDLTSIKGIGPTYANRLREAGISSPSALATHSAEELATISKAKQSACENWITQAIELSN